jgi:predicted acylesterase/phospholipase RssA
MTQLSICLSFYDQIVVCVHVVAVVFFYPLKRKPTGGHMRSCKYISCAGGGNKGIMYLGMLSACEQHFEKWYGISWSEYIDGIKGFAGSSIGTLVSLTMLLNLPVTRVKKICQPLLNDMRNLVPRPDFTALFTEFGIENGDALRQLVIDLLQSAGLCKTATFADIQRMLRKKFVCVATDIHTTKPVLFSPQTTPNVTICDAVFMSMCIPFLFAPMKHEEHYCVDGALSCNLLSCFPENETFSSISTR